LKTNLPELLAPAGTPEAAWAALAYGSDAVYAGLPRFSARAEAGNFDADALGEMIGYAHHLGRCVYITFNTLVQQRELGAALETLATIRDQHADGVIVQDLGVARLVRQHFPQLRLHASTQLAVHNLAGAQQLAGLGFKRVVLARELGVDAIENISRHCGIETEAFIHGALCYSYSGLCLFSSHLLGRSGNRGRCAYCCRQAFESGGEESLPFSMKDFCAADHFEALLNTGVSSLKIEGRMKSPHYVAAVTEFYRRMLDGDRDNLQQRLSDIQTIFGRPSTDLYLEGTDKSPVDPVNDGHRGAQIGTVESIRGGWLILNSSRALEKHDGLKVEMAGQTSAYGFAADELRLANDPEHKRRFELPAHVEIAVRLPSDAPRLEMGAPVYCSYSQAVRQRYHFSAPRPGQFRSRRPVDVRVFQTLEKIQFTASADGVQSELTLDGPFDPARQPEKAVDSIRKCFEKLGDTDWRLNELTVEGDPVFAPMSVLNDARRRLIEEFSKDWKKPEDDFQTSEFSPPKPVSEALAWSVKARVFQPLENIDEFVLEIDPARPEEVDKALAFYGERLRLALPVILRDEDVPAYRTLIFQRRFGVLQDQNERDARSTFMKWEAGNVGALNLLKDVEDLSADGSLYTLNEQAAAEWNAQGVGQWVLSPEDDAENMKALIGRLGSAAVVPVYQHTPLMISATRPEAGRGVLEDRSRRRFCVEPVGREFVLFSETPFSLLKHLDELTAAGARSFRIDLCYGDVSPDLVQQILDGTSVPGDAANFSRGLL
jgi:putative protease